MSACGISGNLGQAMRGKMIGHSIDISMLQRYDAQIAAISVGSNRLGDRAVRDAWKRGLWFVDFSYISTPTRATHNGGYAPGQLRWRAGRVHIFGRDWRALPVFLDSCGYRRELTRTAPYWAHDFRTYVEAIDLLDPDGYAAWDYPHSRQRSMAALHELMAIYPNHVDDGRMWPIYSARWPTEPAASTFHRPLWASNSLDRFIPINKTQRAYSPALRERWAHQAVEAALATAQDPDFRFMAERFGRVMIGGLVRYRLIPRITRHLYAAILCSLYPDLQIWMLGQANFITVNGLGILGLLDRVWVDGSWFIQDARCERFAYVDAGLITMMQLGIGKDTQGTALRQSFFSMGELMAANLRGLLAAFQGLIHWPAIPLPIDVRDQDHLQHLKRHFQVAQLELGL